MDMMGKFLTRSNRSKTQEKEDEDDAWDFISSYRPYNFLFVLMFKIVVVVVVVGIPLESVVPPSTSLCKFVLYPYEYTVCRFGHPKLKIRKLRIIG
jgi:hypothetical protein